VLTALLETTGVVQLPNGISVKGFAVWKKAADGGTEPSVAELATVVKVSCSIVLSVQANIHNRRA
jgi:hypothetical protein